MSVTCGRAEGRLAAVQRSFARQVDEILVHLVHQLMSASTWGSLMQLRLRLRLAAVCCCCSQIRLRCVIVVGHSRVEIFHNICGEKLDRFGMSLIVSCCCAREVEMIWLAWKLLIFGHFLTEMMERR